MTTVIAGDDRSEGSGGDASDGSDVGPTDSCEEVTVEMKADDHGHETSWELSRRGDGKVVLSSERELAANEESRKTACLPPGDYLLAASVDGGDGLCCASGRGHLRAYVGARASSPGGGAAPASATSSTSGTGRTRPRGTSCGWTRTTADGGRGTSPTDRTTSPSSGPRDAIGAGCGGVRRKAADPGGRRRGWGRVAVGGGSGSGPANVDEAAARPRNCCPPRDHHSFCPVQTITDNTMQPETD